MRILRFFGVFVIFLGIFSVVSFLVAREVLLLKATMDLESVVRKMELAAFSQSEYADACRKKGAIGARSVSAIELRFTTDRTYELVAVCQYFSSEPIFISSHVLPPFVKKIPGEGGLIWDPTGRSGVQIESFGSSRTVVLDGTEYQVSRGLQPVEGNKPQVMCQGFGYMCCDGTTQVGIGQTLNSASDCPTACYASCQSRPVVLRLYSDPQPDLQTKIVLAQKDVPVTFFYTIDAGQGKDIKVVLDFGDGQIQHLDTTEGTVSHTYSCLTGLCEYTAIVQAQNEFNHQSVITPVSSLLIRVQ